MERTTEHASIPTGWELERMLEGCAAGRREAWTDLLAEVRRVALQMGRWKYRLNAEDAEDVAQVVQVRVAERLGQLRHGAAFHQWLRRLVHHSVVDTLRRKRPTLSIDDPDTGVSELPERVDGLSPYDQILLRADLAQALNRLPDLYRQPIQMHLLGGMPQDEIGRVLGRPRSTVASQIERGLGRLRRTLVATAG